VRPVICAFASSLARIAGAAPDDIVARQVVLDPGQVEAQLSTEINFAANQIGDPTSVAPDVWWGATERLTVGVIHSNSSVDRIEAGASFCVSHGPNPLGCDHWYHGSGVDARYRLDAGPLAVAPRVRLLVRETTPWEPAVTLGALARWSHDRFGITFDPYLEIGLANRGNGNDDWLFLPITFAVQPTCRWAIELSTGWNSRLATARDGWHVPVELGTRARATDHLDLGAAFGITSLPAPNGTSKLRALFVTLGWRT
jgi:hypothetical protein